MKRVKVWMTLAVLPIAIAGAAATSCGGTNPDAAATAISVLPFAQEAQNSLELELMQLEALPVPAGVEAALFGALKAELRKMLESQGVNKSASNPPVTPSSQAQLTWYSDTHTLSWGYCCSGDYNQDSLVGVNDITPLGQNYLAEVSADPNSLLAVVDGNGDGLITVNDITQIGQNYAARVTGYNVYASAVEADYPGDAASSNGSATLLGSVPFPDDPPPAGQRRMFSFTVSDPQPESYFWVRPTDGSSEGTSSSYILFSGPDNNPPVAAFSADPTMGKAPLLVEFDASGSHDSDGEIVKLEWDWDGSENGWIWITSVTENSQQHEFTAAGTYPVTLRVTDNAGAIAITSKQIWVSAPNVPPTAALSAYPSSGEAPLTVYLSALDSQDTDGSINNFEWDLDGDNDFSATSEEADAEGSPTVQVTFPEIGDHVVNVRVADDDEASDIASAEIGVSRPPNDPPTAALTASPAWGAPPLTVLLDATGSSDPDGTIENYEWDLDGSGTYGDSAEELAVEGNSTAEVEYAELGTITAAVRATDNEDATASASTEVFVVPGGDAAWTMFRKDLRHTGRSPSVGPQTRNVKWTFATGNRILSSPVIGADGTVYVISYDSNLYALNPDGSQKWIFATEGWAYSTPALAADGTIYVGSTDNKFYAINPDGSPKWSYLTEGSVVSSPAVAADGTVYVGSDDGKLYAFEPDGDLKWLYTAGAEIANSSPAIATDGTVYVGSCDRKLHAILPNGSEKWTYTTADEIRSSPAIGEDGTVYVGSLDYKLYAINPNGTYKWSYLTDDQVFSSPAIGADGTIYVGSYDDKLHAINPDGSPKWTYAVAKEIWSSPAVDALGTVYFGSLDGKLYAINPDGTLMWSKALWNLIWSSPAIGPDGSLYVGCDDNQLHAFGPAR